MVSVAFVVTCLLIAIAPGSTFAVMMNQALRHGRFVGLVTVLGSTTGLVFWATASAFGLTALLRTSEVAFVVLKIAGATYLCWLGVRTLIKSRSAVAASPRHRTVAASPRHRKSRPAGGLAAFRAGLFTNITNPKAAVLYLALFPQFLPTGGDTLLNTAVLAVVQMSISASWYTLVVLAVGLVRRALSKPVVKTRIEQVSGLVLVGLGLRVVTLTRAALT